MKDQIRKIGDTIENWLRAMELDEGEARIKLRKFAGYVFVVLGLISLAVVQFTNPKVPNTIAPRADLSTYRWVANLILYAWLLLSLSVKILMIRKKTSISLIWASLIGWLIVAVIAYNSAVLFGPGHTVGYWYQTVSAIFIMFVWPIADILDLVYIGTTDKYNQSQDEDLIHQTT